MKKFSFILSLFLSLLFCCGILYYLFFGPMVTSVKNAADTLGYCLKGTVVNLSGDKQVLVHWDKAYDQAHDPYGVVEPNDFVDWTAVNRFIRQEIWYETSTLIDVVGRS